MQKRILSVLLLAGTGALKAQPPKTQANRTQVPKPVTPVNILKTTNDSVSYVLGEIAAFNLVQQGLGDVKINNTVFLRALNDILGKKQTLMDDVTANALLNNYMVKLQQDKVKPAIEEGNKFLAQNKLKPGVKTTASGLQYEVITEGQGNKPAAIDTFVAHYRGTLLNGLQLMPIGSKYKFWIPYDLGYGVMGQGQIPGGALLIFEVELLDVKKKQE